MAFMASMVTRPSDARETHAPSSAFPASSTRTVPDALARSSAMALARRASPPLGTPQPQGSISPRKSFVCRMVRSMGIPTAWVEVD